MAVNAILSLIAVGIIALIGGDGYTLRGYCVTFGIFWVILNQIEVIIEYERSCDG